MLQWPQEKVSLFTTRNHLEVKFDDAYALNNLIMTAK